MDQLVIKYLPEFGLVIVTVIISARIISKLYADMQKQQTEIRKDHKEQMGKLMTYLDQKNKTDGQVAETLKIIHTRLCEVEYMLKEGKPDGNKKNLSKS